MPASKDPIAIADIAACPKGSITIGTRSCVLVILVRPSVRRLGFLHNMLMLSVTSFVGSLASYCETLFKHRHAGNTACSASTLEGLHDLAIGGQTSAAHPWKACLAFFGGL